MALFRKHSRRTVVLAGLGLVITLVIVAYFAFTESYPNPPHVLSTPLLVAFLVLCPPSLRSVPFIDAEIGTSGFYFIWFFIGLLTPRCTERSGRQPPSMSEVRHDWQQKSPVVAETIAISLVDRGRERNRLVNIHNR